MARIGFFTTRFLDVSETFIFEPLALLRQHEVFAYALQRKNSDLFPYKQVTTIDELSDRERKKDLFWGDLGREKYLLNKMKEQKIELLHAHYGYMGIYALQYKKKLKIPLVTSFYGLDVYKHTRNPFYRRQLKKLFKKGNLFLVCSEQMRQDLIGFGAPPSRTFVNYGGAALEKFPYSFKPLKDNEDIVILMCGRFVEKKGFEYGIKAFLAMAGEYEKLSLKIIGSGKEEHHLKKIVASSPFAERVIFMGNRPHSEYIEEIKKAHIFMAPSVTAANGDKEGLPTVLIEAAALGKPLLATDHSGIAEIVHDKKNGFLVHERDLCGLESGIRKMLEHSHKWPEYAEYGRKLVEKEFDLQQQTAKLEAYYNKII